METDKRPERSPSAPPTVPRPRMSSPPILKKPGEATAVSTTAPSSTAAPSTTAGPPARSSAPPKMQPTGAASVPPPPPSARPRSERPVSRPSVLPPPLSARAPLPSAPVTPHAPKVTQKADIEVARLEEEIRTLRRRLSTQFEATRTEQKNVELLRAEVAQLKATAAKASIAPEEKPAASDPEVKKTPDDSLVKYEAQIKDLKLEHDVEIKRLKREHADAEKRWKEESEAALNAQRQALWSTDHAAHEKDKGRLAELEDTLKTLRQSNIVLRQRIEELKNSEATAEKAAHADDLTALKGIGPALRKSLVSEGITTFAQIAAWNDADIARIAKKIGVTPARIAKNEWVKTAFKLSISR